MECACEIIDQMVAGGIRPNHKRLFQGLLSAPVCSLCSGCFLPFSHSFKRSLAWNQPKGRGLVEHLRKHGSCLGQLLFDMIAMKVMNPRIPFNVTTI